MKQLLNESGHPLNSVCPYFTMFPLGYPLRILNSEVARRAPRKLIVDPYCGRGTTIFAARLLGIRAYGIDVAPVAAAIARAKLASTTAHAVMALAERLVRENAALVDTPRTPFWRSAYHPKTLVDVCAIREGLLGLRNDAAAVLRAIMLGALHGPLAKSPENASYFSNQMPRTFASKPRYSVNYWKRETLKPPQADVLKVIRKRAERVLSLRLRPSSATPVDVRCSDSRTSAAFEYLPRRITHVITSPPYYGLRTYSQDQWLRHWFLGGPEEVDYGAAAGMDHGSPELFAQSMARVWNQIGDRARDDARLYVRFGGIPSRTADPDDIFKESLASSDHPWRIVTRHSALNADAGKRQAHQMRATKKPVTEFDYVVSLV